MTLPSLMRFIEVEQPGKHSRLRLGERPLPVAKAGEVLIKVAAAGVNRPDLVQRLGSYPPPAGASDILGLEIAGEIVALGPEVTDLAVGQSVCALVTGGGYADYCTAAAGLCLPFPKGMGSIEAAALPETFFTVWHNLFQRGRLRSGERFLVHGGGSGIGTVAIQLAKAFGAEVFTTAGSPAKCDACRALGADHVIDYHQQDFAAVIAEMTGGRGVDVILDMVGGNYLPRNIQSLAIDGRHVSIAFLQGPQAEINFLPVMLRRLTLTGSTMRAQSVAAKELIAAELRDKVWPLLASGRVAPQIFRSFPLDQALAAHQMMEKSEHFGKIVLTMGLNSGF
jgi:putative PIG3 family NAD(P)H quinone oxidoreductase